MDAAAATDAAADATDADAVAVCVLRHRCSSPTASLHCIQCHTKTLHTITSSTVYCNTLHNIAQCISASAFQPVLHMHCLSILIYLA